MRLLILAPFLLLLVLFALSNPQTVQLGLWPTAYSIQAPLSLAILVAMGASFLLGAFMLWITTLGARGRVRRAEYARNLAENQVKALEARAKQAPDGPLVTGTALARQP